MFTDREELTRRAQTLKSKLDKCVQKTKKERKEHESIRDSTTRRLAHKLTGKKEKFEQKASKEEKCVADVPLVVACSS